MSAPSASSRRRGVDVQGAAPDAKPLSSRHRRTCARFVAHTPQHALEARPQFPRIERLGDVVVRSHFEPDDAIDHAVSGGDHDDAHRVAFAQEARQREAILARQADIEQNDVRDLALERRAHLGTIGDARDLVIVRAEVLDEHATDVGIVIDHQHARVGHRSLCLLVQRRELWDAIPASSIPVSQRSYQAIHSDAELKGREYHGCLECRPSTTPATPDSTGSAKMNAQTLTLDAGSHHRAAATSGVARVKRSYVAPAPARGPSASNDAAFESGRDRAAELDGWARRAATASGFGDAGLDVTTSRPGFDAFGLAVAARTARSAHLAEILTEMVTAVAGAVRRFHAPRERASAARALREFDSPTLRDSGFDRSAIRSVSDDFALPARAPIAFAPGDSPLLYKTAGLRDLGVDISQWVTQVARRHFDAWRQRRLAWATYKSLRRLDARTLRDIGLDRSEMRSVSAEIAGEADRTRVQSLRTLRALSLF